MNTTFRIPAFVLLVVMSVAPARPQEKEYFFRPDVGPVGLYPSYQYVTLPGHWNVNYFGVTAEINSARTIGLSGSITYGRGSNGMGYVHVPGIGLVTLPFVLILNWEVKDLLIIFLENFHYNVRLGEGVTISPYMNVLGLDMPTEGEPYKAHTLLSLGPGVAARFLLPGGITVRPDVCVKYYFVSGQDAFGSGNQVGLCAGVGVGYIF